ncbi:hypothetical protein MSV52_004664, partial [Escherichia coli]|nr:hypothetical protein [Escherichia coli]
MRKSAKEEGPDGPGSTGHGVCDCPERATCNLRQRGLVDDRVNHFHHGIAKAVAGGSDNAGGVVPALQVRHQRAAGLLWETG